MCAAPRCPGLFNSLDTRDASPVSLDLGQQAGAAAGVSSITFGEVDLGDARCPTTKYDVVMKEMSLHHGREIDKLLGQIYLSLKPGKFLLSHGFRGPRPFGFIAVRLDIVRDFLAVLLLRSRQDCGTGGLKSEYVRMAIEHWDTVDPSETIRSDEIVPVLESIVGLVPHIDYGGNLLMLLLEHLVPSFDPQDEGDVTTLGLLASAGDSLFEHGVIPSDFTIIAARKRSSLAPEEASARKEGATRPPPASEAMTDVLAQRDALAAGVRAIEVSRWCRLAQWLWGFVGRGW
jgi:SAM-dependent methyltransferase